MVLDAYPDRLSLRPGMAHYKFVDVLEGKGDENVLGNSHACGDLHWTRNQRLLAGRVLIPRNAVEASPSAYRAGGLGLPVCLRHRPFLRIIAHAMCAPTASIGYVQPRKRSIAKPHFGWLLTCR